MAVVAESKAQRFKTLDSAVTFHAEMLV